MPEPVATTGPRYRCRSCSCFAQSSQSPGRRLGRLSDRSAPGRDRL